MTLTSIYTTAFARQTQNQQRGFPLKLYHRNATGARRFLAAKHPQPLPHVEAQSDPGPSSRSAEQDPSDAITTSAHSRSSSHLWPPMLTPTRTPRHPYTFHVSVSYSGKPPESFWFKKPNASALPVMNAAFPPDTPIGAWRDRELKKYKRLGPAVQNAGDDFFFVQNMRNNSGILFGVADGVGQWVESQVNPALVSQSLMYHAHRYAQTSWAGEPEVDPTMEYEEREEIEGWEMTPYDCMDLAYGAVLREKYAQAGSTTACLLSLNASSGILRSANLGDSGFSVLRQSSVIYRQPPQTHFFNCPKQLTKLPMNGRKRFSRACVDSPREADVFQMNLRDGDIVVAYTDGFSDNVFPSEMSTICSLVSRSGGTEDVQVQTMADRLVEYARQCMRNKNRISPFEREAARVGQYFPGGKPDDVTVIVALIRETS